MRPFLGSAVFGFHQLLCSGRQWRLRTSELAQAPSKVSATGSEQCRSLLALARHVTPQFLVDVGICLWDMCAS